MFESTNWSLSEPEMQDENKYDLLIPTLVTSPKNAAKVYTIDVIEYPSKLPTIVYKF